MSLIGSASKADYATAIESITFSNSLGTPDSTPRSIEVTVNGKPKTSTLTNVTLSRG